MSSKLWLSVLCVAAFLLGACADEDAKLSDAGSDSGAAGSGGGDMDAGADASEDAARGHDGGDPNDAGEDAGQDGGSEPDACSDDPCGAHATCTVTSSGFQCGCVQGYAEDGSGCVDLDECSLGTDDCDANAECANTEGSFTCACDQGYVGDGNTCAMGTACTPAAPTECSAHAECSDPGTGTPICRCDEGYEGDGVTCDDVDECTLGTDDCGAHAACANTEGGFTCTCDAGFTGDGKSCEDVDECAEEIEDCGINAVCENTVGSFDCSCLADHQDNDGDRACLPTCATAGLTCEDNELCSDESGVASCTLARDCTEVLERGQSIGSGVYEIDPNGKGEVAPFEAYCDMDYDGGGWTLLISGTSGGTTDSAQGTPEPGQKRHLSTPAMRAVAAHSSVIHIRTSGMPNDSVTSTPNTTPITNLRNGSSLYTSHTQYDPSHWSGSRTSHMAFSCTGGNAYPTTIYHACNNTEGLHWLSNQTGWTVADETDLDLFVRGDLCGGSCGAGECAWSGQAWACDCPDGNLGAHCELCASGYALNESGVCTDVDECDEGTHTCAEVGSICNNTEGNYECACQAPDFEGDGMTCTPAATLVP